MIESGSAGQSTRRRVAIVPHTHWDREWYLPFQAFRLRLIDLLDGLPALLDAEPAFTHFMLDGQMAIVDDYLDVRPDAEADLRRLAGAGRLSMGPWYTLPDEFLVSGETLVRNLQLGLRRAERFGGAMEVGYLPDMFGHIAQMPQLLRQFGFEHAVVWRGVPAAIDRSAFLWQAPDGSTVRAEYLPRGYGNGAAVAEDGKDLVRMVAEYAAAHGSLVGERILWMHGSDHQVPEPSLGRVVADANEVQDELSFAITSLHDYLATAPTYGLPAWSGELRSGARANLLMGVASNRVDAKQAAARAERALERLAEPLAALFLPADQWPGVLFDHAWLEMIRNSAHDSICACSHDDVGIAVLHRYAEAMAIAEGIADRAVAALGAQVAAPAGTPIVVNPSARSRAGLVELRLTGGGQVPAGTQLLSERPAEVEVGVFATRESAEAVATEMAAWGRLGSVTIEPLDGADGAAVRATQQPRRKVLARVDAVAGFGYRALVDGPPQLTVPEVRADGRGLDNGLVTVTVDQRDGTYAIGDLAGLGRLVDGGDVGDTYNWCPPADDVDVRAPEPGSVTVTIDEGGPLRGRLSVHGVWRWRATPVAVRTTVELRAGERFVRVATSFDNTVRDHRLRAWFPLPEPAVTSRSECAFAVVERGLEAEGGPTEQALPTFPSRRFVQAGGLTLAHEGLLEYELVDREGGGDGGRARALALTLVRCTGRLSQIPMATRPLPAGPFVPAEAAQMQGPIEVRYAVAIGDGIDPYALVDDAFLPLLMTKATGPGDQPPERSALRLSGAEVSAVRRTEVGGPLEIRVFNPSPHAVTVTIAGEAGWLVDMRGRRLAPFDQSFELRPSAIATLVLASGDRQRG